MKADDDRDEDRDKDRGFVVLIVVAIVISLHLRLDRCPDRCRFMIDTPQARFSMGETVNHPPLTRERPCSSVCIVARDLRA